MNKINYKKIPETDFIDEIDNIKVTLLSYPDPEMTKRVIVDVCYGYDTPNIYDELSDTEKIEALETVIAEGTLPKALEIVGKFVFLIENISLTVTHCIVRHRFFTILQSSTGVKDLRDENFVMPRSFKRDDEYYEKIKEWYIAGKKLYCEGVDKHNLSVQNARLLIPKNNCNHIFIGCDLKALKDAYSQRVDDQEEIIQNNIIFSKMRDLVVEKFPYLDKYFVSSCATGQCLHSKAGKHANVVFKRNELHKMFLPVDYNLNREVTLHNFTRDEMNKGPVIEKETYVGGVKCQNKLL